MSTSSEIAMSYHLFRACPSGSIRGAHVESAVTDAQRIAAHRREVRLVRASLWLRPDAARDLRGAR